MKAKLSTIWILALMAPATGVFAQTLGTAVTYQGRLVDGGLPANGDYDFELTLYDDPSAGSVVGGPITFNDRPVSYGLFILRPDFGSDVFSGDGRWLKIGVRPGPSTGSYTYLTPRQELSPAPHALALPGLWTQQNATSPNLVGGYNGNSVTTGVVGATVGGGGGAFGSRHFITDNYGTVGGGEANWAGDSTGTTSDAGHATVAGGRVNKASGQFSSVGGGDGNEAGAQWATIGGGRLNEASGSTSTVGGGEGNDATMPSATVAGGEFNVAGAAYATVSGGSQNSAGGGGATVGGGDENGADAALAVVGGGLQNFAMGTFSTVGGGSRNTASGPNSTVPGGDLNAAGGDYAFAAGRRAVAAHHGAFVWGDSTDATFASTANDQFLIRATGGVGINTDSPAAALHVGGTAGADGIMFPDGTLQTSAAGAGNTLDQAYDQGGAGAGRTITADAGAVNIAGPDGLTVDGQVGIGIATPQATLHVRPATATGQADLDVVKGHGLHGSGSGTTNIRGVYGRAETNSWTGVNNLYGIYAEGVATSDGGSGTHNTYGVYGAATGTAFGTQTAIGGYFTASGADNNYAAIFDQGNVGIGTSQPDAKLHIGGTAGVDGIKYPDGTLQTTGALPGVAQQVHNSTQTTLTSSVQNLLTRSIDCPTAGYVLAIGSVNAHANHSGATCSAATFGVSDTSATFDDDQWKDWYLGNSVAAGSYRNVISAQKVFAVSQGQRTFYLLGQETCGTTWVQTMTLSLVFFPEAYGTVSE